MDLLRLPKTKNKNTIMTLEKKHEKWLYVILIAMISLTLISTTIIKKNIGETKQDEYRQHNSANMERSDEFLTTTNLLLGLSPREQQNKKEPCNIPTKCAQKISEKK